MKSIETTFQDSLFLVVIFLSTVNLYSQDTLKVPSQFATIQEAFNSVSDNDVVLIAPGTYNENLNLSDATGVHVIGEEGSEFTIVDGSNIGRVFNKVVRNDNSALLQGLTLQNGNEGEASGLYVEEGQTDLIDLVIKDNTTIGEFYLQGGGVILEEYRGLIKDVRISNNEANAIGSANGGGIFIRMNGSVVLEDVTINSNESDGGNGSNSGGLLASGSTGDSLWMNNVRIAFNKSDHELNAFDAGARISAEFVQLDSCSFSFNSSGDGDKAKGGGLSLNVDQALITNSRFENNEATKGAALFLIKDGMKAEISNCLFTRHMGENAILAECLNSEINLSNCYFGQNQGAAIYSTGDFSQPSSSFTINHVTFFYNDRSLDLSRDNLLVTNSVLWSYPDDVIEIFEIVDDNNKRAVSCIIKNGYDGSAILDVDPMIEAITGIPDNYSPALNYANPNFPLRTSLNGVIRSSPANTLADIGAIEIEQERANADFIFFYDENKDGILNEEDFPLNIGGVDYNDLNYLNWKKEGLPLSLIQGSNEIRFNDPRLQGWQLTSDSIIILEVMDTLYNSANYFGLIPLEDSIRTQTTIYMDPFRCGDNVKGQLILNNKLSVIEDGVLWLVIDDRISNIEFEKSPDFEEDNKRFGWKVNRLKTAEKFKVEFNLDIPEIVDASELGGVYYFRSYLDQDPYSEFLYEPKYRCSYDPNDKLVSVEGMDFKRLNDYTLNYTIRFQNTGNDYAKDVTIIDTLSNFLNFESFEFVSSSHPEYLEITSDAHSIVRFHFKDIFLIDSLSSPELSQGWVSFNIDPSLSLIREDTIRNIGHIVFDNNPAIITEEAVSSFIKATSAFEIVQEAPFNIFPNPTCDLLHFEEQVDVGLLYNVEGKIVSTVSNSESMELSKLDDGIYILIVVIDGKKYSQVIVKK